MWGFEWRRFEKHGCKVGTAAARLEGAMVCSEKGRPAQGQKLSESPGKKAQAGRQRQTVSGRRHEWENQSGWRH